MEELQSAVTEVHVIGERYLQVKEQVLDQSSCAEPGHGLNYLYKVSRVAYDQKQLVHGPCLVKHLTTASLADCGVHRSSKEQPGSHHRNK